MRLERDELAFVADRHASFRRRTWCDPHVLVEFPEALRGCGERTRDETRRAVALLARGLEPRRERREVILERASLGVDLAQEIGSLLVDEAEAAVEVTGARVDEPVIGALILAPAMLDSARYFGRRSGWVVWTSRAAKIGGALLVIRAAR